MVVPLNTRLAGSDPKTQYFNPKQRQQRKPDPKMKNYLITGGAGFIGTNFIRHALAARPDWKNIRDWLYVIDHCDALITVLENGIPGETYNIGGGAERENILGVNL